MESVAHDDCKVDLERDQWLLTGGEANERTLLSERVVSEGGARSELGSEVGRRETRA